MSEVRVWCDECKPEKPNGKVFTLVPPNELKDTKMLPFKCEVCGKQAYWVVFR